MIAQAALYLPSPEDVAGADTLVAGRPVAFRAIAAAVLGGAARVSVPSSLRTRALDAALARTPRVAAAVYWLENGADVPPGAVLVVPASVVVPPAAIRRLFDAPAGTALAESVRAGAPVARLGGAAVSELAAALAAGEPLGDLVQRAVKDGETPAAPAWWIVRVTSARTAADAERALYRTLGSAVDSRLDRLVHRRLSRGVTRVAVRAGITANAITLASGALGLAAAWCVWQGVATWALAALALWVAAVVLDHADGEVARLTFAESAIGEWLDIVVDTVVHCALVLAMGAVAQRAAGAGLALGALAAAGFVASAALFKWMPPTSTSGVGAAIDALSSRDGFYVVLLMFVGLVTTAPALLSLLMALVAAGAHAYWVTRAVYLVWRRG